MSKGALKRSEWQLLGPTIIQGVIFVGEINRCQSHRVIIV